VSCSEESIGKYGRAGMLLPGWLTLFTGCRAPGQKSARPLRGVILCALVLPPSWWIEAYGRSDPTVTDVDITETTRNECHNAPEILSVAAPPPFFAGHCAGRSDGSLNARCPMATTSAPTASAMSREVALEIPAASAPEILSTMEREICMGQTSFNQSQTVFFLPFCNGVARAIFSNPAHTAGSYRFFSSSGGMRNVAGSQ